MSLDAYITLVFGEGKVTIESDGIVIDDRTTRRFRQGIASYLKISEGSATCPADPVLSARLGYTSGQPSPGHEPEGLLILRFQQRVRPETLTEISKAATPLAESLGLKVLVLDEGTEAEIRYRSDPLLAALAEQIAAINRLASSNEALVQAMAESEGMGG